MDRAGGIRKVLILTLIGNSVVAVAKIFYGYMTNSIAMSSDGFHSLFDGTSNIIGLIGIWIASRPPDRNHPYGHKKYETLFTLAIASMIFFTCYRILKSVYESFFHDHKTVVTDFSFIVMLLTITVNVWVMIYETKKGKELKSDYLLADARHTKSDILTSLSVILGLLLTSAGFRRADSIIGIVIAFLIARIGYGILKTASDVLVDTICIDTFEIESVVRSVEGVRGSHDIRTRGQAHSIFVDLHIFVDPQMSMQKAHEIADKTEYAIKEKFPSVTDVVVHIEPEEL